MIIKRIEVEEGLARDGNAVLSIHIEQYEGSSFIADSKAHAFAMLSALESHIRGLGGIGQERFIEQLAYVEKLIGKLDWRTP